jgi:hypothetical protein
LQALVDSRTPGPTPPDNTRKSNSNRRKSL